MGMEKFRRLSNLFDSLGTLVLAGHSKYPSRSKHVALKFAIGWKKINRY